MKEKIAVYLACALTHVPRSEFKNYVCYLHSLANAIMLHCNADVYYALRNSDPQISLVPNGQKAAYCYKLDRDLVNSVDIVIAECTYPSIGLGIELQLSYDFNKPLFLLFDGGEEHKAKPISYINPGDGQHDLQIGEGNISLMALGLPNIRRIINQRISQMEYSDLLLEIDSIKKLLQLAV